MKNIKLIYTRRIEDEDGARLEKFKTELNEKFAKEVKKCLVNCDGLTKEDLKNIWLDNDEDLSDDGLDEMDCIEIREEMKDFIIDNDPEVVQLDEEDYGEWEEKDDECSIG